MALELVYEDVDRSHRQFLWIVNCQGLCIDIYICEKRYFENLMKTAQHFCINCYLFSFCVILAMSWFSMSSFIFGGESVSNMPHCVCSRVNIKWLGMYFYLDHWYTENLIETTIWKIIIWCMLYIFRIFYVHREENFNFFEEISINLNLNETVFQVNLFYSNTISLNLMKIHLIVISLIINKTHLDLTFKSNENVI